jgi:hypothetical protein
LTKDAESANAKIARSTTINPMTERSQRPPILKPNQSYTFRSYFLMKFAPADILRELGVTLTKAAIASYLSPLQYHFPDSLTYARFVNAILSQAGSGKLHRYNRREKVFL